MTGIDGNYRKTCQSVMSVLRDNKDSVMAVLEAFVYDPLLNWRLIDGKGGLHSKPNLTSIFVNICLCVGSVLYSQIRPKK